MGALVLGAVLLVRGASRLALSFGISSLVVGLTVVAFGTSAPSSRCRSKRPCPVMWTSPLATWWAAIF
ncbi:MAG TPA: hypothetical protein VLM84_02870 [Chromatiaceae bacterium]|nr:hypothetical protein [Chromatiaceae bacterium]